MKEEETELIKLLKIAYNALRSYQYGNASTELAEEVANAIEKKLQEKNEIASSLRSSQ